MPDVWATFTELDIAMQERLADVLETRGADPRQQAMRRAFLSDIAFPSDALTSSDLAVTGSWRRPRHPTC